MDGTRESQTKPPATGGVAEPLRLWLLGGFRVTVGSREVGAELGRRRRAASLVKMLALARGHGLGRAEITDALWPRLEAAAAANNLHRALHAARRALDPLAGGPPDRYLALHDGVVRLRSAVGLWVDVEAFEEAAGWARRAREPAAYRAAMDLYAGELLPEDLYEAWVEGRREDLRRARHDLLVGLADLHEERLEYGPAVGALELAVAEDPLDEAAYLRLMRLHAAAGRRDEALEQYERLVAALRDGLGGHPTGAALELYSTLRAGGYPELRRPETGGTAPPRPPSNLPVQLTSFVGREEALAGVGRDLAMTRLLTLTGPGGAGKTRLALEAARAAAAARPLPGGAWLVELAPLADGALAGRAAAAAVGAREGPGAAGASAAAGRLAGAGRALVVLDNCEHLIDAAAELVVELLGACPQLKVLATSRQPLGVPGEVVWPVPPLSLPDPEGEVTVDASMDTEAVRLFVERARSRLPGFALTPENAGAVAAVCRKLDGIPLAIELSTARMSALAVGQVAQRLDDSLDLLSGGGRTVARRHQTLRATLDWSHDLLDGGERALFRRLSVFAGGWTPAAARAVGAGRAVTEGEVPGLLSRLVDKSLVVADEEGSWYRMLEPVRQYGGERLREAGEADETARRHASWYFELARDVEPWLRGARREAWLGRLEREYGNLRTALGWALERGEGEFALLFGAALAEFWYISGNLGEGRRWLEAGLEGGEGTSAVRTRALARAGWIAWEQGDYGGSEALSRESLESSRELGDDAGVVAALSSLGWVALLRRDLDRAAALAGEAADLARALDDAGGVARALLVLALAAVCGGEHDRGYRLHVESLALAERAGDGVAAAVSLVTGTYACLGRGDLQEAAALCERGLALTPRPMIMNVTAFHLSAAAALASAQGLPVRAARLWAAADSLREAIGARLSPVESHVYGPYAEHARASLAGTAWREARAEGAAMSVEGAVEYARTPGERPVVARRRREGPRALQPVTGALTRRQLEVARLVADGLTNRQIAAELRISRNTADNHVAAIMGRLGLPSRAAVAVWVTEHPEG